MLQERFVHAKLICLYVQRSWIGEKLLLVLPVLNAELRESGMRGLGVLAALRVLSRQREGSRLCSRH